MQDGPIGDAGYARGMGLFDTVRCRYRLPDSRLQDAEFQTKDLDCLLLTYTVTEEGRLRVDFRDRRVWLAPGQMIVVPRGVEHRPHCDEPTAVLLFEPAGTLNTGDAESELTVEEPERI